MGPLHAPNLTQPTIDGLTIAGFQQALQAFFELVPQARSAGHTLPVELANLDQLKVLYETLPDYHPDDPQP